MNFFSNLEGENPLYYFLKIDFNLLVEDFTHRIM